MVEVHHILAVPQQLHDPNLPLQVLADLWVLLEVALAHRLHGHFILPILARQWVSGIHLTHPTHARPHPHVRTSPIYLSILTKTHRPSGSYVGPPQVHFSEGALPNSRAEVPHVARATSQILRVEPLDILQRGTFAGHRSPVLTFRSLL